MPIKSFVVRDISKEAFWVLDSGIKRTLGDEFTFVGEKNSIALAAGLHQVMRYERGIFDRGTSLKATRHEYKEALERHPGIRDSVRYGQMTKDLMRHSFGTSMHYLFSRKDALEFIRFDELPCNTGQPWRS